MTLTLPLFLGLVTVLQATLNHKIMGIYSLPAAVVFNGFILLMAALIYFFFSPVTFQEVSSKLGEFKLWYILPGLLGFMLVAGIPLSISKLGAQNTFILIIASQLLFSATYDYFVQGISVSAYRLVGIVLAISGAWLSFIHD